MSLMDGLLVALAEFKTAIAALIVADEAVDKALHALETLPEYKTYDRALKVRQQASETVENYRNKLIAFLNNACF